MTNLTIGAMLLVSALQTDTTFAVGDATRLAVEASGGSISIVAWDRPEVRIVAEHSSRTTIDVRRRGTRIDVEPDTERGLTTIVDFVISVPASMDLDLEGMWTRIDVRGARGEIRAETLESEIRIDGGRGRVSATSINGPVRIANAQGRIEVETTARDTWIENSSGELMVEAVGGPVTVMSSNFRSAEVTSVGGRITWNGGIQSGGSYFFGTHGGPIGIHVPRSSGARVTVATIQGVVRADIAGAPADFPRGQRTTFESGDGSAQVEIETFAGRILISGNPIPPPESGEEPEALHPALAGLDVGAIVGPIVESVLSRPLGDGMVELRGVSPHGSFNMEGHGAPSLYGLDLDRVVKRALSGVLSGH